VFVAPFLVTAALTGLAYTLVPQLDAFVYHAYLHPTSAQGTPRPLAEQVAAARRVHPEGIIAKIIPPSELAATTRVVLALPELGEKERTVYVDPYTATGTGQAASAAMPADVASQAEVDSAKRTGILGVGAGVIGLLAGVVALVMTGRRRGGTPAT
jgi:uncharacterized iron-regulated membrane protein